MDVGKMSKKRRNEDAAGPKVAAKKEKLSEFNGTVFKSMLKDPARAFTGLAAFTRTARKLPSAELYDVVEGYVKISMECAEIFGLLEGDRQTESEMLLILESLEVILLRTASDLSHFSTVGNAVVKKTLSSHMKRVQGCFLSRNHRLVRQSLSLLSASVSQGPEAAREVLSHIHVNKALAGLAKWKDSKGKPDVRMAFIQFVLSFLVSGDNATIGQILEVKEFLPAILCTGLKEDRMSVVSLILSTLKSRVVLNKAISKTQKVRFFTPATLASIASLYKWNGIADAAMEEGCEHAGISLVRELTHSFLLDLCCSRKHGISFHDASFGTAGRAGNIVLLRFLVGLRQAAEDELVGELVVNTLKASPDVVTRYFKETQHSYAPRLKSAWQDNVRLLKKIYEAQPEISAVFQTGELLPLPRLLSMIMVVSLPPVCTKAFFTQGLSLASTAAQLTAFSTVGFILKKAEKNAAFLLAHRSDVYGPEVMADLLQQYRETLSKVLPDMTNVIARWQSLTKKDKTRRSSGEDKDQRDGQVSAPEAPEVILLKALILQVIGLYQKVAPHLVSQCKFDFSKFLKGVVSEGGGGDEVAPVLQHQILQLALDLPSSKFSWFRIQEAPDPEKSVLYLLLKMFVSSRCSQLKTSTRMLVLKVLKDSGVFEYTWTELEIWLDQLDRVVSGQQEAVIQFLERVFVKLVGHSHTYADKVSSLVQEAANLQSKLSGTEGDAASVPVSHIDDVLDMLDVITEGNDGDTEEFGLPLSQDLIAQTFPFSVAVLAALEARNQLPADKGPVFEYLSAVLCHVLHGQRDPLPLCLGLLQYDKDLASSAPPVSPHGSVVLLHRYYSKWLPRQCRDDLFRSSECQPEETRTSFTALMKAAYLGGLLEDTLGKDVEGAVASMSVADFPLAIEQTLLYVKSAVEDFGTFTKTTGSAILKTLMGILQDLISELQGRQASSDPEPAEPNYQEGSDLFLEVTQSTAGEANKEQMLLSAFTSIFRHPCLEQWYLALERSVVPPHSLNPVRLKQMCTQLSDGITALLQMSAPALCELGHPEVLVAYEGAVEEAVRKELMEIGPQTPVKHSRPFRALLSLHSYMEPAKVRDVVAELLLLPQDRLVTSGPQTQLSAYGQAALQVLTESTARRDQDHSIFLSQAHLHGLGTLLLSCCSPALEAFLLQVLSREPGSARLIHTDVLLHCLRRPRPGAVDVARLLLKHCSTQRLFFETWCLQADNAQTLSDAAGDFLPLLRTYLQVAGEEDASRPPDVQKEVLNALKLRLLPKLTQSALGDAAEAGGVVEALAGLIKLSADVADIRDLIDKLPGALQRADCFERWTLVDAITEKLADSPQEEGEAWRKRIATAALKCLLASYSGSKDRTPADTSGRERNVLERLPKLLASPHDGAANWNSFVRTGLKFRYGDQHFLNTLRSLLEVMYHPGSISSDLLPLSALHMMASSHSLFLPTMLDADNPSRSPAKEALVSLLLCLVRKCPTACNINHFLVLLGAYGATLSTTDQTLLLLLQEYEKNDISLLTFQSVLWGPAAVEHHKTRKSLGSSLWKQTHSDDILALLNTDRMLQTVARFPRRRGIIAQADEMLFQQNDDSLYDPCFLLPLFSLILGPESVVDCHKFVSVHALGVTVVALSSYDAKVRAAAYHVLTRFYQHLEGARFREKKQLLYLLDMVKNGIGKQNLRLPFVLTTYISKVAQQMLKPEDHMYVVLNRFLLSHQSLDMRRVPEFFKLFYGFDLEHKKEREWILSVLEEGISDGFCFQLCSQQGIFLSLLAFCSSPLCDDHTQVQIVRVLCRAARVDKAAYDLCKNHGLLTWMIQTVEKRNLGQHLLGSVVHMLHTLWFAVLGWKEKAEEQGEASAPAEEKVRRLPLPLVNEFLCVALSVSRRLRSGVKVAQLSWFLQTLSSILKHQVAVLNAARRLTLPAQPLSCADALGLLLCWASLTGHTALLSQIQVLRDKHQVKELFTSGRDKTRRGESRARTQKEDAETEAPEESPLSDCRMFLGSVLTHWRPVMAPSELPPRHTEHPSPLSVETAHLLTRWSLRCLAEDAYDQERTHIFLRWLGESVMTHGEIVDAVLPDAGLKADLLRLYHQVCQTAVAGRRESVRLFTDVMIRLLERRGHLPEMHRAVVSACRPEDAGDEWKCEAGLSLLSLYVHEVWSGAGAARRFLSHVAMVTGERPKRRKSDKWPRSETAVRAVCKDLTYLCKN